MDEITLLPADCTEPTASITRDGDNEEGAREREAAGEGMGRYKPLSLSSATEDARELALEAILPLRRVGAVAWRSLLRAAMCAVMCGVVQKAV